MAINEIYRKYFQKSKIFIYPLLDIKRGSVTVPTETYISWKEKYNENDIKLICVYKTTDKSDYIKFEKEVLLKHTRLYDHTIINKNTSVFVFDFSDIKIDWFNFIDGKYSKIDKTLKNRILNYFNNNSANFVYVESYLFPEKFYDDYAAILNINAETLKSVGELCSKPDLEKETLKIIVKNLDDVKILN